ncbi:hypothetical protein GCM10022252_75600 [Streptosporangium oxazolinicum]|uniref:Helix-turn-helix domain-containing protein n=1 Tax=Streptosporangium oxazolinicum TaxID=909287 RepID=A0ABP8BKX2_9ACTN
MPPRKPLDEAAVIRGYKAGASVRALAAQHGVSYTLIHRRLVAAGVKTRRVGGVAGVRAPRAVQNAIVRDYVGGALMADIVATYGLSDVTVRKIVAAAGKPIRQQGAQQTLDRGVIRRLDGQGWPAVAIAMLMKASASHVRRILHDLYDAEDAAAEQELGLVA